MPATTTPVSTAITEATLEGPYLLENYCYTERPLLQRLRLCQSSNLDHSAGQESSPAPWKEQLRHKFRFLSELTLAEDMGPSLYFRESEALGSTNKNKCTATICAPPSPLAFFYFLSCSFLFFFLCTHLHSQLCHQGYFHWRDDDSSAFLEKGAYPARVV